MLQLIANFQNRFLLEGATAVKRILPAIMLLCVTLFLLPSIGSSQSKQQGVDILKQANGLRAEARSREDLENALKKYEDALNIFQSVGADREKGVTLNNIGLIYNSRGQFQTALEYYEKSLSIMQKIVDIEQEGVTLNNIAVVHDSMGRYQKALGVCRIQK